MATFGTTDDFTPGNANATDGTLLLTYTIGSLSGGFTYQGPGNGAPIQPATGTFPVTWATAPAAGVQVTGTCTMSSAPGGLHVPGSHGGHYLSGSMTFTAPTDTSSGSLSGSFSSSPQADDPLDWSADSGPRPTKAKPYSTGNR
jgi:hypothetical protein